MTPAVVRAFNTFRLGFGTPESIPCPGCGSRLQGQQQGVRYFAGAGTDFPRTHPFPRPFQGGGRVGWREFRHVLETRYECSSCPYAKLCRSNAHVHSDMT
jgi:hypothetical protein